MEQTSKMKNKNIKQLMINCYQLGVSASAKAVFSSLLREKCISEEGAHIVNRALIDAHDNLDNIKKLADMLDNDL